MATFSAFWVLAHAARGGMAPPGPLGSASMQVTASGRQTVPDRGEVRSCDPLKILGLNHITGMAEPKVVKFCTHIGYINVSNRMTYHPQKGCGYGHVTVLKFYCLL